MEMRALLRVLRWPGPAAGVGALEMELWNMVEDGACRVWEGFVVVRGQKMLGTRKFAELPPSARFAMQEMPLESRSESSTAVFRDDVVAKAGARCVKYEAKVGGHRLQAKVVMNKVWGLKETLELELEALRGWHEAGQVMCLPMRFFNDARD